jgi:hypothetical protein
LTPVGERELKVMNETWKKPSTKKPSTRRAGREPGALPRVGRVVACERGGTVLVAFDGADRPTTARVLAGLTHSLAPAAEGGGDVLLVFDGGDPRRPIVVGVIEAPGGGDCSAPPAPQRVVADPPAKPRPAHAMVDGKVVTFSAEEEVRLSCGKGSITLRKDGKIVIRGTHLLSRSTGPVRIKGGHVEIN